MAKMMNLKAFDPYEAYGESNKPSAAKMSATHSKTYLAMTLALRPCGVTAYEAAERLNALGGQPYSPGYTKSAQFAPSYYSQRGYGAYGIVETVGDHIAAVRAHAGDDDAEYARQCLPQQLQGDDTEVLVIYAFAQGGKAVSRYGETILDRLPKSADDAKRKRKALMREARHKSKAS
jgi:hypothetical protein